MKQVRLSSNHWRLKVSCDKTEELISGVLCTETIFEIVHTEYSMMSPVDVEGGSHERCAPSPDLEILIAEGAPGKPGRHVLNADTSDQPPRPHALMPATRNL